jgi:DNA polymerase III subunit epsilon
VAHLSELAVWVADCQTTGASPAHGVVLEIAWGLARADRPEVQQAESYWVALPAGSRVSARVRQLTGYDEATARTTLEAEEVWRRLRASMGHGASVPAAIHFAKFELAFLQDWALRFEPASGFPVNAVCLHAIATRLHPDLPRQSLRALAGFLGHGLDLTRRSAAHVEATAFIWHKLARQLGERGVDTWEALMGWLAAPKPLRSGPKRRRFPLPSARYRGLPDAPGVYRFVRENGGLLYVGKAASLKRRVSGHFTAGSATTPRALEMLTQISDIVVTPTASVLEAALLENEEIKALAPLYNLQLTSDGGTWFSNSRLDSVARAPGAEHRLGPLPSTFSVRAVGAILALASGAEATPALRAAAVEAWERWAPDAAAFASGFDPFVAAHDLHGSRVQLQKRLRELARGLLEAARAPGGAEEKASAGAAPAEEDVPPSLDAWDGERVRRHLERAVAHGHQLLERARWLCLIADSVVIFREPGSERPRRLLLRHGQVIEASDLAEHPALPGPFEVRPLRERQAAFDRSLYDRLRTLTTELKRIQRDGGSAAVRVGRDRWLCDAALRRALRWV